MKISVSIWHNEETKIPNWEKNFLKVLKACVKCDYILKGSSTSDWVWESGNGFQWHLTFECSTTFLTNCHRWCILGDTSIYITEILNNASLQWCKIMMGNTLDNGLKSSGTYHWLNSVAVPFKNIPEWLLQWQSPSRISRSDYWTVLNLTHFPCLYIKFDFQDMPQKNTTRCWTWMRIQVSLLSSNLCRCL
jgi:hypothetical protein